MTIYITTYHGWSHHTQSRLTTFKFASALCQCQRQCVNLYSASPRRPFQCARWFVWCKQQRL